MSPGTPHEIQEHEPDPEETAAIQRLKQHPFLASCSEIVLRKLLPNLVEQPFRAGETILRAGGYSDAAHYLIDGVVAVRMSIIETDRPQPLPRAAAPAAEFPETVRRVLGRASAQDVVQRGGLGADAEVLVTDLPVDLTPNQEVLLNAGDVFGEMSALSRFPISADVVAKTDVTCLQIRVPALRMMFKQKELVGFKKMIDDRYRSRTLATSCAGRVVRGTRRGHDRVVAGDRGARVVRAGRGDRRRRRARGCFLLGARRLREGGGSSRRERCGGQLSPARRSCGRDRPAARSAVAAVAARDRACRDGEDFARRVSGGAREISRCAADGLGHRDRPPQGARPRRPRAADGALPPIGDGLRPDSRRERAADRPQHLHALRRLRARLFGHARRHAAIRPRRHQVPPVERAAGLLSVHRSGLHDRVPDRRHLAAARHARGDDQQRHLHRLSQLRQALPVGEHRRRAFHSPTLGRDIDLATKCDLCIGRPQGPACVQMCPHGSAVRISFKDPALVSATMSDDAR